MIDTIEVTELAVLLTAEELAEMLKVAVRTVWRLRSSGKLPRPVSIGSSIRWRKNEIVAWIDAGCPSLSVWEHGKR